ncbi:MAG: PEP-CTERM sorting domain-containing protein [Candidatus Didemnitutus sp.]|nr:PEP-CTERM sorting domain-containing protein [Candidatus Didemnitutus sp.]
MSTKKIGLVFLLLGLSRLSAVEISFSSSAFEVGKTSTGADLTNGFTFSIGSFGAFSPTALNTASWAANFTTIATNGSTPWDDLFTHFDGTATLSSNAGAFATSSQAYIWGYNTTTITNGVTEWVLFTNNTWLFPASSSPDPTIWTVDDVGTTAVVGTLNPSGSNIYIQTAAITSAVPEPATYAAVLGLLAVGLVAYRRRVAA